MNFIPRQLDIYTQYESILIAAMIASFLILIAAYLYFLTRNRKVVVIYIFSFILNLAAFSGSLMLLELLFGADSSGLAQLALMFTLLLNSLNSLVLGSEYSKESFMKKFDIDHVTRSHFDSTLKTTAFLIIVGVSFTPFMPTQIAMTIIVALIPTIISINVAHLLARRLLRE